MGTHQWQDSSATINITNDAAKTGLSIAVVMDEMDSGFENYAVDMEKLLHNKSGKENRRLLKTTRLEQDTDGNWKVFYCLGQRV